MKRLLSLLFLIFVATLTAGAQVTVNWATTHQTIDGFGAGNTSTGASMSTADENFFFGTGTGQLGLSILRVGLTDGNYDPGDCTSVSSSCAGAYINDMRAVIANGGRVLATPFSPPAAYKTNGSTICTAGAGSGALSTGSYANYATWISNFIQSVNAQGASIYAISIQNEPEVCQSYDSALWTASQIDTFVKTNLGPTLSGAGLTPYVFLPETDVFSDLSGYGGTCMTDASCYTYVGGNNWHDYDATYPSFNSTTNPWATLNKKFWQTEGSCLFQSFCQASPYTGTIGDAIPWAALIYDRLANENANAWLWLDFENYFNDGSNIGLTQNNSTATVAKRAYALAQYSKFVRPGWVRVGTTYSGSLLVTAFENSGATTGAIVVVNTGNSDVTGQVFSVGTQMGSSVTPWVTSSSLNLAAQSSVAVSSGSFTYTIPAQSIVTFQGGTGSSTPIAAPPLASPIAGPYSTAQTVTISDALVKNQDAAAGSNLSPLTATFGSSVGSYHFTVGWLRDGYNECPPDTLPTVSDNGSPTSTWLGIQELNDPAGNCILTMYAMDVLGAPSNAQGTFTVSGGGAQNNIIAADFSGVVLSGALDASPAGIVNGSASSVAAPITVTSANNELVFAHLSTNGATVSGLSVSAATGSDTWHLCSNSTTRSACAWTFATTAGSRSALFSWSSGAITTDTMAESFFSSMNGHACYTTDGSTPVDGGVSGCGHGTSLALGSTISVSSSQTVKAVVGGTAYADSPVSSFTYTITGGVVSVSPSSLGFGNVVQSVPSAGMTATVTNSSGSTITLGSTTFTGTNASDFTASSNTCSGSLTNTSTCAVTVVFTPTASPVTDESATLNVAFTGASGSPVTVALSGTSVFSGGANTYYVSYTHGSDSNNGTSKATPWQHAPGMNGCTANCDITPAARDQVVLEGCVTWPNSAFSWTPPGGTSTNYEVYYGVDKTWWDNTVSGCSTAWNRPIMNLGGIVPSDSLYRIVILSNSYINFDNFEWTGILDVGSSGNGGTDLFDFGDGSETDVTVSNQYVHGIIPVNFVVGTANLSSGAYTVTNFVPLSYSPSSTQAFLPAGTAGLPCATAGCNGGIQLQTFCGGIPLGNSTPTVTAITGSNPYTLTYTNSAGPNSGNYTGCVVVVGNDYFTVTGGINGPTTDDVMQNNVIDLSDNVVWEMNPYEDCGLTESNNNLCVNLGTVSWHLPNIWRGNVIRNVASVAVSECSEWSNNLIEYIRLSINPTAHTNVIECEGYDNPINGASLFFNNVIRHTNNPNASTPTGQTSVGLGNIGAGPDAGNTAYIFNNIMYDTLQNFVVERQNTTAGSFQVAFNNSGDCGPSWQLTQGFADGLISGDQNQNNYCATNLTSGYLAGASGYTDVTNLFPLVATANGDGYSESQIFAYSPISGSSPTVGAGTSIASICSAISSSQAAAGTACLSDTTYAISWNSTTHQVIGPARSALARPSTPSIGAYEYSSSAPKPPTNLQIIILGQLEKRAPEIFAVLK